MDYLYVSPVHRDHCDPAHLRRYVLKKATVLLPEYPTSELEDERRQRPVIEAAKASWGRPGMDVLAELKARLKPLQKVHLHGEGVGGLVRLDVAGVGGEIVESIVIDSPDREVRRHLDEKCRY